MVERLNAGVFYGRTRQIGHVAGVRFVVSEYEAGLTIPRHSHEFVHFCLVLEGAYLETLGKSEQTREPATLLYHPPGMAHAEHHLTRGRHLLIEPDSTWTNRLADYALSANAQRTFVRGRPVALAQRAFSESQCSDTVSPLVIEGLILELFAGAYRPLRRRQVEAVPRWLDDIRELIESGFRQRISLAELARVAGVHPGHMARVFRRNHGCCIGEYQRHLRVKHAHGRIVNSDEPFADIAAAAGFADQSHLTRQVRLYTGQSPQTLRRMNRKAGMNVGHRSNQLV